MSHTPCPSGPLHSPGAEACSPQKRAANSTTRGSLVPLQRLHSRRTPTRTPVSPLCLCTAFAAGCTQELHTEFADGPVPRLCFLDAIHCRSVRCPCSVCLCRLRFALMVAQQVVWRESSHRDASCQHHADADIAAVVRRCPLSSAVACVFEAHVRRNVTFNWLVGDVSEIARMNGTTYAPSAGAIRFAAAAASWQVSFTGYTASTKGSRRHDSRFNTHVMSCCACTHGTLTPKHRKAILAGLVGPYGSHHDGLQRQPLPTAGNVPGHCRTRRPRPNHVYVRAVCVDCGTLLPGSRLLRCFRAELCARRCPFSTDFKCKPRSNLRFGRRAQSPLCRPRLS